MSRGDGNVSVGSGGVGGSVGRDGGGDDGGGTDNICGVSGGSSVDDRCISGIFVSLK